MVLRHAHHTLPTRQHGLDHADQEYVYLPCLADRNHELRCCTTVVYYCCTVLL